MANEVKCGHLDPNNRDYQGMSGRHYLYASDLRVIVCDYCFEQLRKEMVREILMESAEAKINEQLKAMFD